MGEWLRRLRGALLILVFLGVFFYVFSLNFRPAGRMDFLQRSLIETVVPPIQSIGNVSQYIEDVIKKYVWLRNVQEENEALRRQVTALEQRLADYREAYIENLRLRRLLDFKSTIHVETIAAQVVLHNLTGWFQTILIDKGFLDHVAPDMAVVNDEGVVGRILDVSDRYSRVLLITDPGSAVDAIVQRNRVRGILNGKDSNSCFLRYVRGNQDVQVGDLIVTSGKDGIYPKGLRLGVVQGVVKDPVDLFQRIQVKPLVRLTALEELLVIKRDNNMPEEIAGE